MPLFLATVSYTKTPYMGDPEKHQEMRLVEADGPHTAHGKAVAYFEGRTEQYDVYYSVDRCEVTETIT